MKGEKLVVRVRWTATKFPPGWSDEERQIALRRILLNWLAGGALPEGFACEVEWSNPENKYGRHREWKRTTVSGADSDDDGEIEAARGTLNRGGWLAGKVGGMSWPQEGPAKRKRGKR